MDFSTLMLQAAIYADLLSAWLIKVHSKGRTHHVDQMKWTCHPTRLPQRGQSSRLSRPPLTLIAMMNFAPGSANQPQIVPSTSNWLP